MHRLHCAIAAAFVLALWGCGTGMHWSKAGVDNASIARDLDACRAQALGRASPTVSTARSPDAHTDRGGLNVMTPTVGSNERFVAEQEEIRRCMVKRGYELRRD